MAEAGETKFKSHSVVIDIRPEKEEEPEKCYCIYSTSEGFWKVQRGISKILPFPFLSILGSVLKIPLSVIQILLFLLLLPISCCVGDSTNKDLEGAAYAVVFGVIIFFYSILNIMSLGFIVFIVEWFFKETDTKL